MDTNTQNEITIDMGLSELRTEGDTSVSIAPAPEHVQTSQTPATHLLSPDTSITTTTNVQDCSSSTGPDTITNSQPARIFIPEAKLAAPGDHQIRVYHIQIGQQYYDIKIIEQVRPGNCFEYSMLNAIIMALHFGLIIPEKITDYLSKNLHDPASDFERGYVLLFLHNIYNLSKFRGIPLTEDDKKNIEDKYMNIEAELTSGNCLAIFAEILSSNRTEEIEAGRNYFFGSFGLRKVESTLSIRNGIYSIGNIRDGHATAILVRDGKYFCIDTMIRGNVINVISANQVLSILKNTLNNGGFVAFKELEVDRHY